MKTINVNLHSYAELDTDAQQKARVRFSEINTDYSWWDTDYEDFVNICETIAIHTTPQQISFSGFWSQGDGSTFEATIDTLPFIKAITAQAWKAYAPTLELNITQCPCHTRVMALIESNVIDIRITTERPHTGYWLKCHFESDWATTERVHPHIEKELERLEQWTSSVLEQLNRYLYGNLQETYEYLTSDEAIGEAIESNEYLFTSDGTYADWLLRLETSAH